MKVGKICQRNAVTVGERDEITKAAQLMREKHVGYLVVTESCGEALQRPIGVLTDRDIVVTVVARETDPRAFIVGEIMTRQPVSIAESDSVETALHEMRRIGVRRMPVVGSRGELVGVLSLDDLLTVLADQVQSVAGSVLNERRIEGTLRP